MKVSLHKRFWVSCEI